MELLTFKNTNMRTLLFIIICFCSGSLLAQTESTGSITYINVSGDNAYLLDSITYSTGSLTIIKGITQDSSTLRAALAVDTLSSTTNIATYTASYARMLARMASLQTLKTADSLRMVFWTARKVDQVAAIDSIIAN